MFCPPNLRRRRTLARVRRKQDEVVGLTGAGDRREVEAKGKGSPVLAEQRQLGRHPLSHLEGPGHLRGGVRGRIDQPSQAHALQLASFVPGHASERIVREGDRELVEDGCGGPLAQPGAARPRRHRFMGS
jgi:hypothetical protein